MGAIDNDHLIKASAGELLITIVFVVRRLREDVFFECRNYIK